jgi:PAS domain S-box-containing protein
MTSADHTAEPVLEIGRIDAQLEEAFTDSYILFKETTRKYMEAYKQLEEQFEYLNVKLEETNEELRKSLEEQDRVSNYLNNILESMSAGVLVVDPDGNITLFNHSAEEILCCTQAEVLGQPYARIMGLEAGRERSVLHTLETGEGLSNQKKDLPRAEGRTLPLGFCTSLVRDKDGHILGAVEVFNDLTEVKRLEAQVQRMHTLAALGEMAATVAHEIRNPLGGIAAYAALLERDLEVEDPRRRLVQKITAGVGRLNRIVSSLLSYTRPLNLNTYPADLVAVVEEAAAFFEIELERHHRGVALNRRYPTVGLVCPLDPEQFQQVVLNLLQNATQAMPGGGTIDLEISTRHEADESQAVLCVRDAGVGMTVEVQEKLFTPFFTTKEDGTGLGLVTSKKIVDAHGGHIHVESRPGDGTSFTIHLPQ